MKKEPKVVRRWTFGEGFDDSRVMAEYEDGIVRTTAFCPARSMPFIERSETVADCVARLKAQGIDWYEVATDEPADDPPGGEE
jgi:hypothetical protein